MLEAETGGDRTVAHRRFQSVASSQLLSSASNFLITFSAALFLDLSAVADMAVAIGLYALLIQICRGFVGEIVLSASADSEAGSEEAATAAVLLGILMGGLAAMAAVGGILAEAPWGHPLLIMALAFPALALLDTHRLASFRNDSARLATRMDAVWLAAFVILLIVPPIRSTSTGLMIGWVVAAGIALLVLPRPCASPVRGLDWLFANAKRGHKIAIEQSLRPVARQLIYVVLGLGFSYESLGVYRLAEATLGPVNVGVQTLYLSELRRRSLGLEVPRSLSTMGIFFVLALGAGIVLFDRAIPGLTALDGHALVIGGITISGVSAILQARRIARLRNANSDRMALEERSLIELSRLTALIVTLRLHTSLDATILVMGMTYFVATQLTHHRGYSIEL